MSDISSRIKKTISEKLGVPLEKVTESARIVDDLGADSLDTVELLMNLEEEFEIEIPDSDTQELISVQKVIDYVSKKLSE